MWERKTVKYECQLYAVKNVNTDEIANPHALEAVIASVTKTLTDLFHGGKTINITTVHEENSEVAQMEIEVVGRRM